MKYWIVPSNDNTFRIADAMAKNGGIVDWRQSNKFSVGDIVFIYKSLPEQMVRFRMEVVGVSIPEDEALEQEEFWTDKRAFFDGLGRSVYVRFKLIEEYKDDILSLHHLHEHGFKGNIQSVQGCPEEAVPFLEDPYGNVNSDAYDVDYPVDDDKLYEGALVKVMANKYERNRRAREKCVELKGYKCLVCGRDFVETYGKIGKNFIHVHHLVPISSIRKEYKLNVEKDLAPVCPNCHYMLHRKDPPYSIEDLQRMMKEAGEERMDVAAETAEILPLQTYHEGCVPLYNLKAACGAFEDNEKPEIEGWFDATGHGFRPDPERHFAVYAKGNSMIPKIYDGDICIFERYQGGSRNGEIVLTQCNNIDPDTGCKYTIKKYHSQKTNIEDSWQHESITLSPLNHDYEDIHLDPDETYITIGIFKCTLTKK